MLQTHTNLSQIGAPHSCLTHFTAHRCLHRFHRSACDSPCFYISYLKETGGRGGTVSQKYEHTDNYGQPHLERGRNISQKDSQSRARRLSRTAITSPWALHGSVRAALAPHAASVAHLFHQRVISQGYCSFPSSSALRSSLATSLVTCFAGSLARQSSTSYSSSIPCSRLTRSLISSAKASASSARAFFPSVTMKFA